MQLKQNKATILILCVTILTLLSILAVLFAQIALMNYQATQNYSDTVQARYLAQAGIEYCHAKLRESASKGFFAFQDWQSQDSVRTSLEELKRPSYAQDCHGREDAKCTGEIKIGNEPSFYLCRVTDNSSKINVNEESEELLQATLKVLFDQLSVSDSLADKIVAEREDGYINMEDLQLRLKISEDIWEKISPYLCTHSASESLFDPKTKRLQSFYPININTAEEEVLGAIWANMEGETLEGRRVSLSASKVNILIEAVLAQRPFFTWNDFATFLRSLTSKFSPDEMGLIFANVCPLVLPNTQNPDDHINWPVDRLHLIKYGLACTLYPGGIFHIESRGELIRNKTCKASCQLRASTHVFSHLIHNTQEQFHVNRQISDFPDVVSAVTGPRPIGHLVAKLEDNSYVEQETTPEIQVNPDPNMGVIMRGNGLNNEANLHFLGDEGLTLPDGFDKDEAYATNYYDGKASPIAIQPPMTELPRGTQGSMDFFFKPGPEFDFSKLTPIFRNFSMDEGIATEIYWDSRGYLRAARTLACSKELEVDEIEPKPTKVVIYKGVLRPTGFQEIIKIGTQIYKQNLQSWQQDIYTPLISTISYTEAADPACAADFGYAFASKLYRALAEGTPGQDRISLTMRYSGITVVVFLIYPYFPILIPIPLPIPFIENGLERKLTVTISEYLDVVFEGGPEIYEVQREPDQLSLRSARLYYIPMFSHPNPVSRSEYQLETRLHPNIWYRLGLVWDGIEIKQFSLTSIKRKTDLGQEQKELSDTPLNIWRVLDVTMEHQMEFAAPGTYIYANPLDFARYKNSYFQGRFLLPAWQNPSIANMAVTAFMPKVETESDQLCNVFAFVHDQKKKEWVMNISLRGGLVQNSSKRIQDQLDYLLFLSGNLYLTPVVSEIRARVLHLWRFLDIQEF